MKVTKIPKPFDYKAACEALFNIMKKHFDDKDKGIVLTQKIHSIISNKCFATYIIDRQIESIVKGWHRAFDRKVKENKQIARFEYHPTVNNVIEVYMNESDFTQLFQAKLYEIEAYCENKIVFDVNVQEGK